MKKSSLELTFDTRAREIGLPPYETQYRFAAYYVGLGPGLRERLALAGLRDWRFDVCWPDKKVAVELDGGVYANGRHTRGSGYEGDCEKLNVAVLLGWRPLRFTTSMLKRNPVGVMDMIKAVLADKRLDV